MDTSAESFIGSINPFRWKGHYYDVETGLYFIEGRFYDPETGTYLNAADAEQIEENAFSPLGLDRNGILCNNILNLVADIYTIFTVLEMNPDPDYDPDANKPWWELAWNAVTKWLAEKISGLMEWYNGIPWGLKVVIGVAAFIIAVVLTYYSGGSMTALFVDLAVNIIMGGMLEAAYAAKNGGDVLDGLINGFVDGTLSGGITALGGAFARIAKILRKGIVIGETMIRVEGAAKRIGAATYKAPGKGLVNLLCGEKATKIMLKQNQRWIERMMKWGVKITDIGSDTGRLLKHIAPSIFYEMEKSAVLNYKNIVRMFWPPVL